MSAMFKVHVHVGIENATNCFDESYVELTYLLILFARLSAPQLTNVGLRYPAKGAAAPSYHDMRKR